jgi:hypothetical protein
MLGKVGLASVAILGLATAASADGYENRARAYYAHPFTWSGCYVGAHVGADGARRAGLIPLSPILSSANTASTASLRLAGRIRPANWNVCLRCGRLC